MEVGHEEERHFGFSSFYCLLFPFHKRKSMFAVLHSDINSLKYGLLHLTSQPCCRKSRSAKVKDGIINLFLRTISLIDTQQNNSQHNNIKSQENPTFQYADFHQTVCRLFIVMLSVIMLNVIMLSVVAPHEEPIS